MENFTHTSEQGLSPQQKLVAHFRGIQKVHENAFESVHESIVKFTQELKTKFTPEELLASEAYHVLIGSTMREHAHIPDPVFKDIEEFVKNTLSRI